MASWTASTAQRTPGPTATTWTATVKPTEVGGTSYWLLTKTQTGKLTSSPKLWADHSTLALHCVATLNGRKTNKTILCIEAQSHRRLKQTTRGWPLTLWCNGTRGLEEWLVQNTVWVCFLRKFYCVCVRDVAHFTCSKCSFQFNFSVEAFPNHSTCHTKTVPFFFFFSFFMS